MSVHEGPLFARQQADAAYDLRQRRIVGPFFVGNLIQGVLVGLLCGQYWTLVTQSKVRPSPRLHAYLLALVILNITSEAVAFAVRRKLTPM